MKARLMILAQACVLLNGCGLIMQGTKQTVAVRTVPEGARVSFGGTTVTTPADVTIDRKIDWRVARASKDGYHEGCAIIPCSIPGGLAFLDFMPGLGISFVIDRMAGGLRRCPDVITMDLSTVEKGTEPIVLPSDAEVLYEWSANRSNICKVAIPVAESIWAVDYDVNLLAVDRPGMPRARYGPVERVGVLPKDPDATVFQYSDRSIKLTVAPVWDSIQIQVQNLTNHAAKIVWDEVVFIDFDQTSHRVIHSGVRYIDRNQSQPPSVLAPHKRLIDNIVPVNRIDSGDGPYVSHLALVLDTVRECNESEDTFKSRATAATGRTFGVFLPIEIGGIVNEYTMHFRLDDPLFVKGVQCLPPKDYPASAAVSQGAW